jgi:poly-gamma-glutamate synthesis protein (capsule biosynthesis protein)
MKQKTKFIKILFLLISVLIIVFLFLILNKEIFVKETPKIEEEKEKLIIAGGIVPHHLLASELIERFFKKLSLYEGIENIVILAPDHYRKAEKQSVRFLTSYYLEELKINESVINNLLKKNPLIKIDERDVLSDQGVSSLLVYFSKYFNKKQFIPFLISPLTSEEEIKNLIDEINNLLPQNTIIIGSVDFGHYLPQSLLYLHDVKSIRVLLNFEVNEFLNLDVDSWQALYGVRYFARLKKQEKPIIIGHKTSFDYFEEVPKESELFKNGGTSYFSVIFEEGEGESISNQFGILMVGDIMMGRKVEDFTNQFGLSYPFLNIKNIFRGFDIVCGNLEGPVMEKAPSIPLNSVSFAYPIEVIKELKKIGFNLLTLSNNHSLDKGLEVLKQTRSYLIENGIQPLGDYRLCNKDYYYYYKNLLFIGANLVYQNENCVSELVKNIKDIKEKDPSTFIIVIPHWGTEYVHYPNDFQKETAHLLIDAGADLIVGHHPHVVQSIEKYRDKLIFYSLGNFVFDMYFSKAVQEELGVGLALSPKEVTFYLIPFKSKKSQLFLMEDEERKGFLNWLATVSSPYLHEEIKSGKIIVKINN